MKVIIQILRTLLTLILCAVLLLNIWMLVQQSVMKREAPEIFGYSQYIVNTGSMEPTISAGDMILIRREDSYQLGDVVTFRTDSMAGTHRIMGSVEGKFITRGDANNVDDMELLAPENILGKVALVVPKAGFAAEFLRSPLGLLLVLTAGFLIIKLPDWVGTLKTRTKGKHTHESQS